MSKYNQVTFLNDLPIEEEDEGIDPSSEPKYQKFIRNNNYNPAIESGMIVEQQHTDKKIHYNKKQQPPHIQQYQPSLQQYQHPYQPQHYPFAVEQPTCLQVAEHIQTCPICSKLYNNDKTMYIITIVLLSLVIIILLKKIMNI